MKSTLSVLALASAALSVGCGWTVNIAVYRTWTLIPPLAFGAYQNTHAMYFVPIALLFGLPSLAFAVLLAWRGLAHMPRALLWIAAALAAVPWVATPVYFIPLQGQLHAAGPTTELVNQLVSWDLLLRVLPPTIQFVILCAALIRSQRAAFVSMKAEYVPAR